MAGASAPVTGRISSPPASSCPVFPGSFLCRLPSDFKDLGLHGPGLQNGHGALSRQVPADLPRVQDQGSGLLAHGGPVGVAMDHGLEDPGPRDLPEGALLVAVEEGDGPAPEESCREAAPDLHVPGLPRLYEEEGPVPVVVPEDPDAGAPEGGEPGDHEGGDEVTGMEHQVGGDPPDPCHRPVHHGEVVMGVREDTDAHSFTVESWALGGI